MRTVARTLNEWMEHRQRMQQLGLVAASTLQNQAAIVQRLMEGLGEHGLADLRKSHVELHVGERLQTCKPVTVQGELNVLRQVLNWAVDEQLLNQKPRLPTIRIPSEEHALPSDEAFLWVLANVPSQHATALEFMMLTGLSPHELERLRAGDERADGDHRYVGIGQRADFAVKQDSRRRWVPLSPRALTLWFAATAGMQPDQAPFPRVAAMQKAIRRAVDTPAAPWNLTSHLPGGLDNITPKLMRKWFASKVAGQQPEHVLQRLMGHAPGSPITRRHYVRSTETDSRVAVDGLAFGRG